MIGGQDLGGIMGFGPVVPEADEPAFHAEWERRAFAITLATGALGRWGLDMSRHAREARDPVDYLSSSYYEIWIKGLEPLLVAAGLVEADEIAQGRALTPAAPVARVLRAPDVDAALARGSPSARAMPGQPRFNVRDKVRMRQMYQAGHTRLPRYAFGKCGVVEAIHGGHVFPDAAAAGRGEQPQWLYTICFTGRELWGDAADGTMISVDAWESYFEPA